MLRKRLAFLRFDWAWKIWKSHQKLFDTLEGFSVPVFERQIDGFLKIFENYVTKAGKNVFREKLSQLIQSIARTLPDVARVIFAEKKKEICKTLEDIYLKEITNTSIQIKSKLLVRKKQKILDHVFCILTFLCRAHLVPVAAFGGVKMQPKLR